MAVVIFKAIESCNSNCIYCGVIEKHQDIRMSLELLEQVFVRMNEYLQECPEEIIEFTWHGGEACLLGADYYRKAYDFQERHCPTTKARIRHLIQSNMTLISQELIDAFKTLGISSIGSSFDPTPGIRGIGTNRDSALYNRQFFKGVELVERNGLNWGVIMVIHRRVLDDPMGLLNCLTNLNLSCSPILNKIYLYKEDPNQLNVSPTEYADFLGQMLPTVLAHRERFGAIRPITTFLDVIEGRGGMVCDYSGMCTNRWMYIGPTGTTSHCGRAGDFDLLDYGNIRDTTMKEVLYHHSRQAFAERQTFLQNSECKDCRFWGLCHGGCPVDALADNGNLFSRSGHCEFIKRFLEVHLEPATGKRIERPAFTC